MALFSAAVLLSPGNYCLSPCLSNTFIKTAKLQKNCTLGWRAQLLFISQNLVKSPFYNLKTYIRRNKLGELYMRVLIHQYHFSRSTLADRRPKGSETPGESLPGSAAQSSTEWDIWRETGQGKPQQTLLFLNTHCYIFACLPSFFFSFLSPQMVSKLPVMKSICNLHIDKLEFFRLVHPETAYSFPPLYREVFGSEMSLPDSTDS